MPRKRKGRKKGEWVRTTPLDDLDPHIQWAVELEVFALNVHAKVKGKTNLHLDRAREYLAKLLKKALDAGHSTFIVIHGSSKGMKTWLWKLKRLFGRACSMYKSCKAISKIKINEISPALQRSLLRTAA